MSLSTGILVGEETTLTPASSDKRKKSLRTTFPISFVRQFGLEEGDCLRWDLQAKGSEISISVHPVKTREKKRLENAKVK